MYLKKDLLSSGFFRFFSRVAELMLLNLLFILCCLPIITMGASLSALYSVCLKLIRKKDSYIVKDFFRAFRLNLKQGILLHLILSVIATVVITDLFVVWNMMAQADIYKGVFWVMAVLALFLFMASMYIYPMLAQFENTVKGYFRNAVILSIKHLRNSVILLLFTALPLLAAFMIPGAFAWEILLFLLFGFSGMVYINSIFFSAMFAAYLEEETDQA